MVIQDEEEGCDPSTMNEKEMSTTELDSQANMPVAGQNIHVLADHGKSIKVSPFTPHCEPMSVRLIDAAIQYGNLYDGKSYILAI